MIKEIKRKFKESDLDCRMGEAEHLPIEDQTVDYVFSNMYLHHVQSPLVAIREMSRVLKPGDKLVITNLDEHQFEFLQTEQHNQ